MNEEILEHLVYIRVVAEEIHADITALNTRFAALCEQMVTLGCRFDNLIGRLDRVDQRLERICSRLGA